MANWMNQRWHLNYLPLHIQLELADALDVNTATGLGYLQFASYLYIREFLVYTADAIRLIEARSPQGRVTMSLLEDYGLRGGTIQGVQYALERIGHRAAEIIPAYFDGLSRARATPYTEQYTGNNVGYSGPYFSGNQQTEPSDCNCPRCQGHGSYSNASSRPNTERSILNGSVYTGSSGTRRRTSKRERDVISSRRTTSGTNTSGRASPRTNSSSTEQGTPVSEPLPNMSDSTDRSQNPFNNNEINNGYCFCEDCRLRSDTDQTQRLTLDSAPKVQCLHRSERRITNEGYGHDTSIISNPSGDSEAINSGMSRLYLDSEESGDTSFENVENSDETFVKSVISDSEIVNNEDDFTSRGIHTGPVVTNNRRPICSRSNIGEHRLGERLNDCTVCRNFTGAIPKSSARQRNNSVPQKSEITETDLRRSWHGPSGKSAQEEIRKVSSDSKLLNQKFSITDHPQQQDSPLIGETIYSRISSGESFGEYRTHDINSRSVNEDSTDIENNSVRDIYQNNLESENADVLTREQAGGRNIVQSDSSNCSEQEATAPCDANSRSLHYREPQTGTSFEPVIQLSNDYAQIGNPSVQQTQQRLVPPPHAHHSGQSQAPALPNFGSGESAQQNVRSGGSVQQNFRSGGSAQQGSRSMASAQQHNGNQNDQERRSGDFVLVTYSWNGMTDPESFIQEVIHLCIALREAGIRVKIDMDDESYASLRLNKLDWIDRNVREAKYVVVCISPTYAADIREPDPRNQASPRSGQLNARYIYDKLRNEYYSNSSQNRRIIPVMFHNYGTTDQHLPSCMRSTLIYKYPDHVEQIVSAILGFGRFRPS